MSKEKQIEEIDELTTVLYETNHKKSVLDYHWLATEAYNAGYRKQSEGEWIEVDDGVLIGDGKHLECSECGVWSRNGQRGNFCSSCGAKMKGGAEV